MTLGKSISPIAAFLALALTVALLAARVSAASPPMSRTQYAASLRRVDAAIAADREGGSATAIAALAPILHCSVRLGQGLCYIDNSSLASYLGDALKPSSARQSRLDAARAKLAIILADLGKNPDVARTAAGVAATRSILSASAYASDPIPPPSQMDDYGRKISKWWDDLMKKLSIKGPKISTPHINPKIPLAILIVIVTFAAGVLIWYFYGLYRNRTPAAKRRPESLFTMNEEEAELVASRNFDRLMDLANQHATAADHRSAFRLVYVALLVALDTDGIVRLNRSKTNWEYLRDLRSGRYEPLYDLLLPMTRDFDRIWYGFALATSSDYEQAVEHYQAVRSQAAALSAPVSAQATAA
ncbi:MAG TPA: DUF4129 domain-containing protein [Capsulimonadaceae bacterium]|jgi:hypothetical protein